MVGVYYDDSKIKLIVLYCIDGKIDIDFFRLFRGYLSLDYKYKDRS